MSALRLPDDEGKWYEKEESKLPVKYGKSYFHLHYLMEHDIDNNTFKCVTFRSYAATEYDWLMRAYKSDRTPAKKKVTPKEEKKAIETEEEVI